MPDARNPDRALALAESPEDVRALHQLCRQGRLYDVEHWIVEGKPLQIAPEAIPKGTRPKTALQITLETGQHSLASLLLKSGYRLELERYGPLDLVLQSRRWDLFDLLLEWGGDLKSVDVYTVLDTYNAELYERFRAAGYDLTERHEMASMLGHGTRNRPLLGFVKRRRSEDPKIQQELNIALGYHVRAGNERPSAYGPAPTLPLARAIGADCARRDECGKRSPRARAAADAWSGSRRAPGRPASRQARGSRPVRRRYRQEAPSRHPSKVASVIRALGPPANASRAGLPIPGTTRRKARTSPAPNRLGSVSRSSNVSQATGRSIPSRAEISKLVLPYPLPRQQDETLPETPVQDVEQTAAAARPR
jgi:hypothetical protein